jgi:hypothetical protein
VREKKVKLTMYKVIDKEIETEFPSLDQAMKFAKELNVFVTIKSKDMEIVGMFGADSIKDGKCPDGIDYTWKKRRI